MGRKEITSGQGPLQQGVVSTGTTFSLAGYRYASEKLQFAESEVINRRRFYDNHGKRHNLRSPRSTSKLAIRSVP